MKSSINDMKFKGSLSIFLCAGLWGLFWIALRYFDEAGVKSLWAVAFINLAASCAAIPVAFVLGKFTRDQIKLLAIMGLGMGTANVFYFAGIILSDVVRVIFLFYLLPIWATLFSKILFDVQVGTTRMVAIVLAVAGIWLLLGGGGWPVPENVGDIFGILAGMFWALGLTLMRGKTELDAFAVSAATVGVAFPLAMILAIIMSTFVPAIQPAAPSAVTVQAIALPMAAFGMLVLWPTIVGQLWGAKHVAATTAALITMSEILVATISTALLAVSDLPWIAWFGAGLIMVAVLIDLFAGKVSRGEAII